VVDTQRQDSTPDEQPVEQAPAEGESPAAVREPAAAREPAAVPEAVAVPEPTEAELAEVAEPALVRRAPKVGAFLTAGVLLGALLGLVAALVAGPSSELRPDGSAFIGVLDGQGGVRLASAFAGALLGALVGAGLALLADRRSVRRAERDRRG